MNQGNLEVVKQEMARVNVDILGISDKDASGTWLQHVLSYFQIEFVFQAKSRQNPKFLSKPLWK